MKTKDLFPGRFVCAEDLTGPTTVKIDRVVLEDVRDLQHNREAKKPVAYFAGAQKGLLLNRTNWKAIARAYGNESDAWKGKTVTLTVEDVEAFGEVWPAIRVKIPKGER